MSSIHAQIAAELDAGTPLSEIKVHRRDVTLLVPRDGETREHARKRMTKGIVGGRPAHHQERHHRRLRRVARDKQQEIYDAKNPKVLAETDAVLKAEQALKNLYDPKLIEKRKARRG